MTDRVQIPLKPKYLAGIKTGYRSNHNDGRKRRNRNKVGRLATDPYRSNTILHLQSTGKLIFEKI